LQPQVFTNIVTGDSGPTNGVAITDAIKFVRTNKEKPTMSTKEDLNGKESREPDHDGEDKDQLEEKEEMRKLSIFVTRRI
jgi:hypothetical protein